MIVRVHRWGVRAGATAVTLAVAALLAGCSGGGTPSLSEAGLHDKVRSAAKQSKQCPLDYDLDKAASAAHVSGHATAVSAQVSLPEDADKDSVLATRRATDVECDYRLGSGTVSVETLAAEKGTAGALLAPVIQRNAGLSMSQLTTYLPALQKTPTGTPLATPTGNVALVRLHASGTDSVALMVSCGTDEVDLHDTELTPTQVRALAGALADQARW